MVQKLPFGKKLNLFTYFQLITK